MSLGVDVSVAKLGVATLIGAFVIFFVMTSPNNAATIVHSSWHVAVHVAHGIGNFVDKLTS